MAFFHNIMLELRAVFTDIGVLLVMVAAVIIYAFVYPLPYAREVLQQVPVVVIDTDQSALSRKLIRMVDASELLRVEKRTADIGIAQTRISAGRESAALMIPRGFEKNLLQGKAAHVSIYVDAAYFLVYRQATTGLARAIRTLSAGITVRRFQARGLSYEKAMVAAAPLRFIGRPLFNPHQGYATYIVPGVFILLLQQTMLIGMGMLAGTRQEKPLTEALGNPLRGNTGLRILSRTVACLMLYFVHVLFIYGIAYRIWGFPRTAELTHIALFMLPFLTACALLAQALAAFFKTRETAIIMLVWSSMLAVLVSGFSWPVESMPHWLRAFSMLIPSTAAVTGMLRLTQMGASFQHVMNEWAWLWALCGLYLALAWLMSGYRQKRALQGER